MYYFLIATFKQLYDEGVELEDGMTTKTNTYQPKRPSYQLASSQMSGEIVELQALEGK